MACQIKYNQSGKINQVLDSTGKVSEVYRTIAKHPLVNSKEDALEIFKNVYGSKVNNENASFMHKTKYGTTDSYKEALEDSNDGDTIEIGFQADKFIPIINVEVTTNPKTVEGFVNLQIKNNLLSEERVIDPDGTFFKAKGNEPTARAINTAQLEQELRSQVGLGGYKRHKGAKYTISDIKPKVSYEKGTVDAKIAEGLANSSMMRTFGKDKLNNDPKLSKDELKVRLLNLLNELGIKVTSISDYIDRYNTKNGVDPSANALADISEKIIAFQDGEINIEELTEEVSHFIIEGFPKDQVDNLLRNVHNTPEWVEYSDHYREVYSKEYSGEALEEAVRKEILGKVLANSLQTGFSTQNKQGTSLNIIEKLRELFRNFMDMVRGRVTEAHRSDIQDFTQQVRDMLMSEQLGTFLSQENFQGNKFRFYSSKQADNSGDGNPINMIRSRSTAAIEVLRRQISDLAKTKKGSGVSKQQLQQAAASIHEKLGEVEDEAVVESITTFLEVTRKQISYINTALKNNEKDKYALSQEEVAVFQSLKNDLDPILSELKERVKAKQGNRWRVIEDRIASSLANIKQIEGTKEMEETEVLDRLVDKIMERHNLSEDYRGYVREWYETAKSDTSYFHTTFGQLVHAHDPLLSLAGVVIQDTMNEARINYLKETKQFQQDLKELGLEEKDLDQFFDKGYLVDVVDHKGFSDALTDMRLRVLQKYSEEAADLSMEELKRRYKSPSSDPKNTLPKVDPTKELEMNDEIRRQQNGMVERVMKKEYYEKQEKRYKEAGAKPVTINFLRAISQTRGGIMVNARTKEGIVDRTLLSESDNNRLNELVRDRKIAKSPFNSSGNLKKGLMYNTNAGEFDPKYVLDPSVEASTEGIIAANIHAIDASYMEENQNKDRPGMNDTFIDALEKAEAESNEAALDFLDLNSTLSFTQEFWDSFGANESVLERLDSLIEQTEDLGEKRDLKRLYESIRNNGDRRKNLIKAFQRPNNPAEMDVDQMDKGVRDEIKDLSETLDDLYARVSKKLGQQETDGDPIHEQTTNQAYKDALEDMNITSAAEELDFIKTHVTNPNALRIAQLEGYLADYKRGIEDKAPLSLRMYIEENIDLDSDFDVKAEVRNYAKSRLLPYYKRLAPEGHQALMSELRSGRKPVSEFVKETKDGGHFIQITPNYSFIQEDNDMLNPNYRKDYEGGALQPKHGQYKNQKFENLFAPKKDSSGNYITKTNEKGYTEYVPTQNENLYKGYEVLKQYQRDNLEQIGELGSHSLYKLPQISKSRLEKVTDFASKASSKKLKEAWRDFSMYRVDELERGAEFDGQTLSNSKVIPKYYTRDLESEDDISTQLFTSYAAFAQQAYLHRARRNNIGDMFALREKLLARTTGNVNKGVEATNTYKMFKSYMDANFFGITEQSTLMVNVLGREVDLTKIARQFLNFIKFKNLGLSAIVPATSWLTAEVNTKIENLVREHTNQSSADLAFKEYRKLAPDSAKEFMNIRGDAKLTVLGEFMGIFDSENRYKDASYNKAARLGWNKIGMGLHQAANFPIIPRIMLSVMYDHRVVDGSIINYNDFARQKRTNDPKLSDKAIETEWKEFEGKSVYDYVNINETTVEWKKEEIGKELGKEGEDLDKFLANKLNGIQSRIEEASSNIDGSISNYRQVGASRHYLLNYFMTHRNWLTIATSRRFKLGQTNLQTGEKEEGSWVTAYSFIGEIAKELNNGNYKNFRKVMRQKWADTFKEGEEGEKTRKNLKRVGIDIAVLNSMALIGFLIANAADDEDNEDLWALQMANYLYHRTLNETASSSLALPYQYLETLESPFVGLNTVQELGKLYKVFNTDEVNYGKYGGMTVGQRQLVKTVPGVKQYREVLNPKASADTYRFYNERNFNAIPLNWFIGGEE